MNWYSCERTSTRPSGSEESGTTTIASANRSNAKRLVQRSSPTPISVTPKNKARARGDRNGESGLSTAGMICVGFGLAILAPIIQSHHGDTESTEKSEQSDL